MNLVKKRKDVWFPSIMDEIFTPDLFNTRWNVPKVEVPAVNVMESDTEYTLEFAAPGLKKEDFNIEINEDVITVSAERKEEKESTEEGKYTRREFSYSSFKRSFNLPDTVDQENVKALQENGVLKVVLPKREEVVVNTKRTIEVG